MLIKYYNDAELAYANRKRYSVFNFSHFYEEEQKSITLGDGSSTSIKTSKNNLCNYVTIDDTRWFVVSYIYINGGQVRLNLQRDVIGEFGISDFFGKIERGYTNNILKNKKELSLNQILKKRIPLKPKEMTYGSWSVNNHTDEAWGIIYLTTPTSDGSNSININIPGLSVPISSLPNPSDIDLNEEYLSNILGSYFNMYMDICIKFDKGQDSQPLFYLFKTNSFYRYSEQDKNLYFDRCDINLYNQSYTLFKNYSASSYITVSPRIFVVEGDESSVDVFDELDLDSDEVKNICKDIIRNYLETLFNLLKQGQSKPSYEFNFSQSFFDLYNFNTNIISSKKEIPMSYNNAVLKEVDNNGIEHFYKYNVSSNNQRYLKSGNLIKNPENNSTSVQEVSNYFEKKTIGSDKEITFNKDFSTSVWFEPVGAFRTMSYNAKLSSPFDELSYINVIESNDFSAYFELSYRTLSRNEVYMQDLGGITLNSVTDYIDEPYSIYVIPLFNTKLIRGQYNFEINKSESFFVFNYIVQYLSGSNGYLVDAQIYPYCPNLSDEFISLQNSNVVLLKASSTSYDRVCSVNVDAFNDVKKDYICRQLSIVSPEQSNKYSFNFYDYKVENNNLEIIIKTSLKPFQIVSSAIVKKDNGSLMGINYNSDLFGSQPTSNGFEVSISTNNFQEYARNNSNYEKIFNKNQDYLNLQHKVEREDETIQGILNTLSATMMGAVAGGSTADVGLWNTFGAKAIGATVGATVGAGVVGGAMISQYNLNEKLREYEYSMQKELFDLNIGQIKNLPNKINRISSFNEIILRDFYYVLEIYECSQEEKDLVDLFIEKYSYSLNVYGLFYNYWKSGSFLKGNIISSNLIPILHNIASKELQGGIYYYGV